MCKPQEVEQPWRHRKKRPKANMRQRIALPSPLAVRLLKRGGGPFVVASGSALSMMPYNNQECMLLPSPFLAPRSLLIKRECDCHKNTSEHYGVCDIYVSYCTLKINILLDYTVMTHIRFYCPQ